MEITSLSINPAEDSRAFIKVEDDEDQVNPDMDDMDICRIWYDTVLEDMHFCYWRGYTGNAHK